MASKPLVIRLNSPQRGYPAGTELGFHDIETAGLLYEDFDVVQFQDGTAYSESVPGGSSEGTNLRNLSRNELNELAVEQGLDPKDFANKDLLVKALEG